jgi:hypothetical protein
MICFKGHFIYMDNFYSSIGLFKYLRQNCTGACGTVHDNRKGLPTSMKGAKMKKGDLPRFWTSHHGMLACTCPDTGTVNMLSIAGNTGVSEAEGN